MSCAWFKNGNSLSLSILPLAAVKTEISCLVTNMLGFMQFKGSGYDVNYMDSLYIKLDQDLVFANMVNVNISFGSINYTSAGASARASLVSKGFVITSGGQV